MTVVEIPRSYTEATDPVQYALRPWRERLLERLALMVMRLALMIQGQRYL